MIPPRGVCADFGALGEAGRLEVSVTLLIACGDELTCISCTLKERFVFQELLSCGVDNELSYCKINNWNPNPFNSDKPAVCVVRQWLHSCCSCTEPWNGLVWKEPEKIIWFQPLPWAGTPSTDRWTNEKILGFKSCTCQKGTRSPVYCFWVNSEVLLIVITIGTSPFILVQKRENIFVGNVSAFQIPGAELVWAVRADKQLWRCARKRSPTPLPPLPSAVPALSLC